MGVNRYKIEYECDCGLDGGCGQKNVFYLNYLRTSNTISILHKNHMDDPDSKMGPIMFLGDNGLDALRKLLDTDKQVYLSFEELKEIKETGSW